MTGNDPAWSCRRCGGHEPRLGWAPWPGQKGRTLQETICARCWDEWLGMQTRIINEYRLNVLDPGHSKALQEQMDVFLGFKAPEGPA